MKFSDVKFAVPQIRRMLLLNEEISTMELATLEGGTITINSVTDRLQKCKITNCRIVSLVPLTVDFCHIEPIGDIKQVERIDKNTPHAIIEGCVFDLCHMPKADYGNNYVRGKVHSSKETAKNEGV